MVGHPEINQHLLQIRMDRHHNTNPNNTHAQWLDVPSEANTLQQLWFDIPNRTHIIVWHRNTNQHLINTMVWQQKRTNTLHKQWSAPPPLPLSLLVVGRKRVRVYVCVCA